MPPQRVQLRSLLSQHWLIITNTVLQLHPTVQVHYYGLLQTVVIAVRLQLQLISIGNRRFHSNRQGLSSYSPLTSVVFSGHTRNAYTDGHFWFTTRHRSQTYLVSLLLTLVDPSPYPTGLRLLWITGLPTSSILTCEQDCFCLTYQDKLHSYYRYPQHAVNPQLVCTINLVNFVYWRIL